MQIGVIFPQTEFGSDPLAIKDYAQAVEALGFSHDQAREVEDDIRRRDAERMTLQLAEGEILAGKNLMHTRAVVPEPLVQPKHASTALNAEAQEAT